MAIKGDIKIGLYRGYKGVMKGYVDLGLGFPIFGLPLQGPITKT